MLPNALGQSRCPQRWALGFLQPKATYIDSIDICIGRLFSPNIFFTWPDGCFGWLVLRLSSHSSGDFTSFSPLDDTLQNYISAMRYLKLLRTSFQVPNRGPAVPLWSGRFLSQDAASSAAGAGVSRYDPLKTRSDFEELFLDKRVRYLLKRLTGYNPAKVFASKSLANLNSPKYRFMTDEQLNMVCILLKYFLINLIILDLFTGKRNGRCKGRENFANAAG